ncbi:MAG: hypothetical protein AAFV53_20235 [Myxococcota bacterium]
MALISLEASGKTLTLPLSASTLLGRHHHCTWRVPDPRLPLYWIELRWIGRRWGWRVLADPGNTRGPLTALPGRDSWRVLKRNERVYTPRVSVTLIEGGPPRRFALDLDNHDIIEGGALEDVIEDRADGPWPVDAESRPEFSGPLEDGQLFFSCGRPMRFSAGEPVAATVRGGVSLARASCALYIDHSRDGDPKLTVMDGDIELEMQGAYVRAAIPYVEARRRDIPVGGWLTIHDVYFRWLQVGGSEQSGYERIAQDRSRLCRAMARKGVAGAHELFETQRKGQWFTRISLPPSRIDLSIEES